MHASQRSRGLLARRSAVGGVCVLLLSLGLSVSACAAPRSDEGAPVASAAAPSSPQPTPVPSAPAGTDRVETFCAANAAASAAVQGTVAEDIVARQAQADAARALLPIEGASPEVAAGAETFVAAAEETVSILADFPADALVADIGTDPRILQSQAVTAVSTDPDYQAFLLWTMDACGLLPSE